MTESEAAEIRAILPSLLQQARQAGANSLLESLKQVAPLLVRPLPPAQSFSEHHKTDPISNQDDDEDGDKPESSDFSAADIPHLKRYFAADDEGQYPGHLHRYFKCSRKQFADHANLVQKQIEVNRDGKIRKAWKWIVPKDSSKGSFETKPSKRQRAAVLKSTQDEPGKQVTLKTKFAEPVNEDGKSSFSEPSDDIVNAVNSVLEAMLIPPVSPQYVSRALAALGGTQGYSEDFSNNDANVVGMGSAVLQSPQDYTNRLILADALQESGDPRHELVRAHAHAQGVAPVRRSGSRGTKTPSGIYRSKQGMISWLDDEERGRVANELKAIAAVHHTGQEAANRIAPLLPDFHPDKPILQSENEGVTTPISPRMVRSGSGHWIVNYNGREVGPGYASWVDAAISSLVNHRKSSHFNLNVPDEPPNVGVILPTPRVHSEGIVQKFGADVDQIQSMISQFSDDAKIDWHKIPDHDESDRKPHPLAAKFDGLDKLAIQQAKIVAEQLRANAQDSSKVDELIAKAKSAKETTFAEYPPVQPKPRLRVPDSEGGSLSPEQIAIAEQAHQTGDHAAWGALADHLADNGYPSTGATISRLAEGNENAHRQDLPQNDARPQQEYPPRGKFNYAVLRDGVDHVHIVRLRLPSGVGHTFSHRIVGGINEAGRVFSDPPEPHPEQPKSTAPTGAEFGTLTPEQGQIATAAVDTNDHTAWGALGDHLADTHPSTGYTLGRFGEQHPNSVAWAPPVQDPGGLLHGQFTHSAINDDGMIYHYVRMRLPDGRVMFMRHFRKPEETFADPAPLTPSPAPAPTPKITLGEGEPLMGGADFMHQIHDESGNRVGHVWVSPMEDGERLHINHIGAMGHEANSLGPAVLRDAYRQLKAAYPSAKRITGTRVSGSTQANTGENRPVDRQFVDPPQPEVRQVAIHDILPDKKNLELAVHSLHQGRPSEDNRPVEGYTFGDKYALADGHHRLLQAILAGKDSIPLKVKPSKKPPSTEWTISLNPDEDFYGLGTGLENGWLLNRMKTFAEPIPKPIQRRAAAMGIPAPELAARRAAKNPAELAQSDRDSAAAMREAYVRNPIPDIGKAMRAAAKFTNPARRRRVIMAINSEKELAQGIGGHHLRDSEPADVIYLHDPLGNPITDPRHLKQALAVRAAAVARLKDPLLQDVHRKFLTDMLARQQAHAFEVKSLFTNKRGIVQMNQKAQAAKKTWSEKHGIPVHVAVLDRRVGNKFSGNKYYVAPNSISPTTNIANAKKVANVGEVLKTVQVGDGNVDTPKTFAEGSIDQVQHGHEQFQKAIRENPEDHHTRAVYADWLEENDPESLHPEHGSQTLHFLRKHEGPALLRHGEEGHLEATPAQVQYGLAVPIHHGVHPGAWSEYHPHRYPYQGNGILRTAAVSDGYVTHMRTLDPDESLQGAMEDYGSSYNTHGVPVEVHVSGTEFDPSGEEVTSDHHAFVTHGG